MSKKIRYEDLAEKDLFQPAIDQANELLKVLDLMEKQFKDNIRVAKELKDQQKETFGTPESERIKKLEEAIQKLKKALEGVDKVEKERETLQKRLKDIEEGRLNNSIQLREQIRLRTRNIRQEFRENNELATAYERQSARLVNLRKRYKDLAAQNKENSAEAKDLLKEITTLDKKLKDIDDTVGQNVRSVGNYKAAVNRLTGSFKVLAGSAVVAVLTQIVQLFNQNSEGAASLQKALGRVTVTLSVLVSRFLKAIPLLQRFFIDIGRSFELFALNVRLALTSIQGFIEGVAKIGSLLINPLIKAFESLGSSVGFLTDKISDLGTLIGKIPELFSSSSKEADTLKKRIAELEKEQSKEAVSLADLANLFSGVTDEISALIDVNDDLIDKTIEYQKEINSLNQELEQYRSQQKLLQLSSDDTTTSISSQVNATKELIATNIAIAEGEEKIANRRFELAKLNAQVNKDNIEAQTEFAEAAIALEQARSLSSEARFEGEQKLREIEQEQRNLDIDQLIDLADRRKTINESIGADESLSFERRANALSKAQSDIDSSFRKLAERLQKGLKETFNIDELIAEEDTVALNERIKALDLDGDRQNRLREILQERLQATEDLRVAQKELNEEQEKARDIEADITLQEEALLQISRGRIPVEKVLQNLAKDRLQTEIDNLTARTMLFDEDEKNSIKFLELQKELNDKLLEQEAEALRQRQEQRAKFADVTLDFVRKFSEKQSEATLNAIDKEIAATEQRQESLRSLAEQGVENAEQNIALEERKQAELEAKREAAIKRQARQELLLTSIETYNAKLQAGEPNPLASTALEIVLLEQFINNLPGFYSGTENVADALGNPDVAGKDGYIVRVDGNERILNPLQNAMIGDMTNNELATLANDHQRGSLGDNDSVVRELKRLSEIVDAKPVYLGRDYDSTKKAIIDSIASKGRIERRHKKGNSIF